jgi:ribosomal protein L3 glutamine methyltransferase
MNAPAAGATLRTLADWLETELGRAALAYGHGTDNPRDEAVWLLLAALGYSPVSADVDPDQPVDAAGLAAIQALLERRVHQRRPLAYLTGRAWFAGRSFRVDERVLVPRSPLAEPIGERFAPWIGERPVERILDLGTGSGCIAVACADAFPEATIDASDVDPQVLALARENIERHGLADRIDTHLADVYAGLPEQRRYDLIVSNPPYVAADAMAALPTEYRHEPSQGLAGGVDGLAVIERILTGACQRLADGGHLVVEAGTSGVAVEDRWPELAPLWLAFAHGGDGAMLLGRDELRAAAFGEAEASIGELFEQRETAE